MPHETLNRERRSNDRNIEERTMPECTSQLGTPDDLLARIDALKINEKYDTRKLDSEDNESYLKTFRRGVGALYKCAMKIRFTGKAADVLTRTAAEEGADFLYIDGRVGNDFVVERSRGGWKVGKVYLPDEEVEEPSFLPGNVGDLEYDDIKGHSVPNWTLSLEKTSQELCWIRGAVKEMKHFNEDPDGANVEDWHARPRKTKQTTC